MIAACPGTWRILCTGLHGLPEKTSTSAVSGFQRSLRAKLFPYLTKPLDRQFHALPHIPSSSTPRITSVSFGRPSPRRNFASGNRSGAVQPSTSPAQSATVKPLSSQEISSLFRKQVNQSDGNRILQIVQEQRLAGTIDEDIPGSPQQKQRALIWLRRNYPLDEEKAILQRLDREEEAANQPNANRGQASVYGDPAIDRIRNENIAKRARREEEEKARKEEEAKRLPAPGTTAVARRPGAVVQWAKRRRKEAEESGLKSVPEMSFFQRVGPATLMTIGVVSLCIMFAQNYIPTSRAARLFPDVPTAAATIGALILINAGVWFAWHVPIWRFMNKYFLLFPAYPYAVSIVANNLSHQAFKHLAINMISLWFIGTNLHEDIGRGPFLAVYIGCGATASYIFLLNNVWRKNWAISSLGCSGAICALLALWLCINSDKGIRIWPFPPAATEALQPLAILAFFIGLEISAAMRFIKWTRLGLKPPRIDHLSHLAGYGSGIVASQFVRPLPRRRRKEGSGPQMERVDKVD
ncbi:MAG: hypothetical protein Q9174_001965 [Haloplaca sp. 1 TL-2023]